MKKILFIPTMWKRESIVCVRENREISERERERERWKGFGCN